MVREVNSSAAAATAARLHGAATRQPSRSVAVGGAETLRPSKQQDVQVPLVQA